jgi:hypothetical protein
LDSVGFKISFACLKVPGKYRDLSGDELLTLAYQAAQESWMRNPYMACIQRVIQIRIEIYSLQMMQRD